MPEIILIGTRHANKGHCNSEELYKILERVNPEVIFEEIPPSLHSAYYEDMSRENLESNAVKAYVQDRTIQNVPVDHDQMPPESFFDEYKKTQQAIERVSHEYCNLVDTIAVLTGNYGFRYLNSDLHDNHQEKLETAIELALNYLKKERFFEFQKK